MTQVSAETIHRLSEIGNQEAIKAVEQAQTVEGAKYFMDGGRISVVRQDLIKEAV